VIILAFSEKSRLIRAGARDTLGHWIRELEGCGPSQPLNLLWALFLELVRFQLKPGNLFKIVPISTQ
jgi:hypothetical protein